MVSYAQHGIGLPRARVPLAIPASGHGGIASRTGFRREMAHVVGSMGFPTHAISILHGSGEISRAQDTRDFVRSSGSEIGRRSAAIPMITV